MGQSRLNLTNAQSLELCKGKGDMRLPDLAS